MHPVYSYRFQSHNIFSMKLARNQKQHERLFTDRILSRRSLQRKPAGTVRKQTGGKPRPRGRASNPGEAIGHKTI